MVVIDNVVRELEALDVRASALQVNLTGTAQIAKLVGDVRSTLQRWNGPGLDILINNAGIMRLATFDKVTEDDLDTNYQTLRRSFSSPRDFCRSFATVAAQ